MSGKVTKRLTVEKRLACAKATHGIWKNLPPEIDIEKELLGVLELIAKNSLHRGCLGEPGRCAKCLAQGTIEKFK